MTYEERKNEGQLPGLVELGEQHLDQLLALMIEEGWYYYDHHELKRYLKLEENCYVLQDRGETTGSIFTTNYGNQAWIGNVVVKESERRKGHARNMIHHAITRIAKQGQDTFRLASVPEAIKFYQKPPHVFHPEYFTTAQQAALPLDIDMEHTGLEEEVREIEPDDIEAISTMDARFFRSDRLGLFRQLHEDSIKKCCLCLEINGEIKGFLMVRRRKCSKQEGNFRDGPDHVFRIGPCCVSVEYGMKGFKALFQKAIRHLDDLVKGLNGEARMYIVFPRNARKEEIYEDLLRRGKDPVKVFAGGEQLFQTEGSVKNTEQWEYLEDLGFREEYYELVMSHTIIEDPKTDHHTLKARETRANAQGIFASASPGDKA